MWFGCDETPDLSKVIRTSIVAVGASTPFDFMGLARLGANAALRSEAILTLSQVVVMLSWKSLRRVSICVGQLQDNIRAFNNEDIVLVAQAKGHATLDQFFLARLSEPVGIA